MSKNNSCYISGSCYNNNKNIDDPFIFTLWVLQFSNNLKSNIASKITI